MAAPPQPPGSSSASSSQPPSIPPNSDQITWEGDKMFNIYILDYCKKRGYHKTANQLVAEAEIPPESKPPINAQQGLLFEWWSVFWVLFQAKNSGNGSDDAILYTRYQTQAKYQQRPGQVPPPQPPARYPLPNGVPGPIPPLPSAQINGIGPAGQPPSLSAPPPYAPTNPATQPNGIPGPPPPQGPPGQPFAGGMVGRPPIGAQQRLSNGAPQYHSPTIAPSPQLQGNPQQTQNGPMGQLGRSPHMSNMNRAAMPPPNGPQGPGPAGSAHQTPTPTYQQLGRPPSRHDSSSHHPMNPHRSPALAGRVPPGQDRPNMDGPHSSLDAELASYPPELVGEAKLQANLGNRDAQSLSVEEKQTIIQYAMRLKPGSSGGNMPGQMQNRGPMAQPMQQQHSMQQQRGAKRNSTSPGEEHQTLPRNDQSPPERKRLRKTPNPAEQQQQPSQAQQQQQSQQQQSQQQQPQQQQPQQQQQQPTMAHIGSLPPGSQPMAGTGPVRGPVSMGGGQGPLNGFGGPQMHQIGLVGPMTQMHGMSPGGVHGPPHGVVMNQQMQSQSQLYMQSQYRQAMANMHKNNPNAPLPPVGPGDPQSQAHVRGAGPPGANRLPGQLGPPQGSQPPKPMGGSMPPPGQPGMSGPQKPNGKEGEGELGGPPPPAPTPTSLLAGGPPMNPQRPPTASGPVPNLAPPSQAPAPGPMADIHFDMADMFDMSGGDFNFNTTLTDMDLYFDTTSVHDGTSLDMK